MLSWCIDTEVHLGEGGLVKSWTRRQCDTQDHRIRATGEKQGPKCRIQRSAALTTQQSCSFSKMLITAPSQSACVRTTGWGRTQRNTSPGRQHDTGLEATPALRAAATTPLRRQPTRLFVHAPLLHSSCFCPSAPEPADPSAAPVRRPTSSVRLSLFIMVVAMSRVGTSAPSFWPPAGTKDGFTCAAA